MVLRSLVWGVMWLGWLGATAEAGEIRAATPKVSAFVADARGRSETLRRLASAIEASDLIVLVLTSAEPGNWRGDTRLVSAVPAARVLVIRINQSLDSRERLAVLGHEWQHACEVASDAAVVDQAGMQRLFERAGHPTSPGGRTFETQAAQDVERIVRSEIALKGAR